MSKMRGGTAWQPTTKLQSQHKGWTPFLLSFSRTPAEWNAKHLISLKKTKSYAGNIHRCPPYIVYVLLTCLPENPESRKEERLSTCPELTLQTASSAMNCAVASHSRCKMVLNTCKLFPKCSCLKLHGTCKLKQTIWIWFWIYFNYSCKLEFHLHRLVLE